MTEPTRDGSEQPGAPDPVAATAHVDQFSQVEETEASVAISPSGGSAATVKGKGTPGQMVRLVLAPAFSALGLPVALVLILADKPLLLALIGFLVPQGMAGAWWWLLSKAAVDQ